VVYLSNDRKSTVSRILVPVEPGRLSCKHEWFPSSDECCPEDHIECYKCGKRMCYEVIKKNE